ncbi:hypothetical protein B0H34DRAFT_257716 [Crassisporium funariophilum]|nr:hypothetical protein B0H34DRAFT_257716 [Crassisporium funariophilum]
MPLQSPKSLRRFGRRCRLCRSSRLSSYTFGCGRASGIVARPGDSRNNISTSLPPPFRDTKTPTTQAASRRSSLLLLPSNGVGGGSRETVRRLRGRSRLELDRRFMVGEAGRVGCGRHGWSRTTQKSSPDDDKEYTIPTPLLNLRLPRSAHTVHHSCIRSHIQEHTKSTPRCPCH